MSKIVVSCSDCGIPYSQMGVDLVLPNQVWAFLVPDDGILCANCICLRLSKRGETTCLQAWPDNFIYEEITNDQ